MTDSRKSNSMRLKRWRIGKPPLLFQTEVCERLQVRSWANRGMLGLRRKVVAEAASVETHCAGTMNWQVREAFLAHAAEPWGREVCRSAVGAGSAVLP